MSRGRFRGQLAAWSRSCNRNCFPCPGLTQNFFLDRGPVPGLLQAGAPKKSSDCGPEDAGSGPIWGPWKTTEKEANAAALERVRNASQEQCHGGCPNNKPCNYPEAKSHIDDIEERTENGQKQYRSKASTSGRCQCE